MKKKILMTMVVLALGGVAVTALGGMSWLDALGLRGQERMLEQRVHGYWEARVDGDLEDIARFVHPMQTTIPDPGLLVTESYELNGIDIDGDRATAHVTIHSRLKHPVLSKVERTLDLENEWVRYEGQWYLDVKPVGYYEWIQQYNGEWQSPTAQLRQ